MRVYSSSIVGLRHFSVINGDHGRRFSSQVPVKNKNSVQPPQSAMMKYITEVSKDSEKQKRLLVNIGIGISWAIRSVDQTKT